MDNTSWIDLDTDLPLMVEHLLLRPKSVWYPANCMRPMICLPTQNSSQGRTDERPEAHPAQQARVAEQREERVKELLDQRQQGCRGGDDSPGAPGLGSGDVQAEDLAVTGAVDAGCDESDDQWD